MIKLHLVISIALILFASALFADETKETPVEKVPENLEITLEKPEDIPTVDDISKGKRYFKLNLKNTGKQKVALWSHVTVTMTDSQGQEVKHDWYQGRFGIRFDNKSILEHCKFVEVAPGKTHTIKIKLGDYPDAEAVAGWQLKNSGDYNLQVRYQYDRNAIKKKWGEGCRQIDDPKKLWNRALEVDKTISIPFHVK